MTDGRPILSRLVRDRMKALGLGSVLTWTPHVPHPRQLELLTASEPELGYGGAGGGGKSDGVLMWLVAPVDVPGYSGIAFRRTHTDLALKGALMDRARDWFADTGARWHDRDKRWEFPSVAGPSAAITFGYLESDADRFRYKSAEFQRCAFDEVTQFPSGVGPRYLWSRLRRPANASEALARLSLQMVFATNPGDVGHAWVKDYFGLDEAGHQSDTWDWRDPQDPNKPPERMTRAVRRWIRALLEDNPSLDAESYDVGLRRLDDTTYAQLRRGLWIIDGALLVFKYDDARNGIDALPDRDDWLYGFGVDVGTSDESPTTAFVKTAWNPHEKVVYVVRNWEEAGLDDDDVADRIEEQRDTHGDAFQGAVIDTGGLGKVYVKEARRRAGLVARAAEKAPNYKQTARKLMNGDLEKGLIKLVRGACAPLIRQLQTLTWNVQRTDTVRGVATHSTDALLYAWRDAFAFISQAPNQQPAPGSSAALELEAKQAKQRERERYLEKRRTAGESW